MPRLPPATTSTRSAGMTSTTDDAGTHRKRCRFVRTSSNEGSKGLASERTRSTIPCPPPVSEKPTQLASQ
jgi:hypothetical protein